MSNEINLEDITNNPDPYSGTGVFDHLMKAMTQHIEDQYQKSRLNGADYAKVYLGIAQSVLSESIRFSLQKNTSEREAELIAERILSERKNNEEGGTIDLQKEQLAEQIKLLIAQTDSEREKISSSQADTLRRDTLNAKEVVHRTKETELVEQQKEELELNGQVERLLTQEKITATAADTDNSTKRTDSDISLNDVQKSELLANGVSERDYRTAQISKVNADVDLTNTQKSEMVANGTSERNLRLVQIDKTNADINLLETQRSELMLNGTSQRDVEDSQVRKNDADVEYTNTRQAELVLDGVSRRSVEASNIAKNDVEISLIGAQEDELILNGVSKRALEDSAKEKNQADVQYIDTQKSELISNGISSRAVQAKQVEKLLAEILNTNAQTEEVPRNALSQRNVNDAQINKIDAEVLLLSARQLETTAATARQNDESVQKILLMGAQTLGFKTDAKQKLLRQLYEGYGMNVTTSGEIPSNAPAAATGPAIDAVVNDLLDDLQSSVDV